MARLILDPADPPALNPEVRARMDAASEADIAADAAGDTENPPLTASELARVRGARVVSETRKAVGLSQPTFAKVYGFSLGRLRDLEQGRIGLDTALAAYLTVIRKDPAGVRATLMEKSDG